MKYIKQFNTEIEYEAWRLLYDEGLPVVAYVKYPNGGNVHYIPYELKFAATIDETLFGYEAGQTQIHIASNGSWTIDHVGSWITVGAESGNGDAVVNVDYTQNGGTRQRSATITVTCGDYVESFVLNQEIHVSENVVCQYRVENEPATVQLFNADAVNPFSSMIVDGSAMAPAATYEFGVGDHSVEFVLADSTVIPDATFSGVTRMVSCMIPNSVLKIRDNAFYTENNGQSILEEVILGNQVWGIGYNAFRHQQHLSYINFPASLGYIGGNAFRECYSLEEVNLSACHMERLYGGTFFNCTGATSVTFNDHIRIITNNDGDTSSQYSTAPTFYGLSQVTSLILPKFLFINSTPYDTEWYNEEKKYYDIDGNVTKELFSSKLFDFWEEGGNVSNIVLPYFKYVDSEGEHEINTSISLNRLDKQFMSYMHKLQNISFPQGELQTNFEIKHGNLIYDTTYKYIGEEMTLKRIVYVPYELAKSTWWDFIDNDIQVLGDNLFQYFNNMDGVWDFRRFTDLRATGGLAFNFAGQDTNDLELYFGSEILEIGNTCLFYCGAKTLSFDDASKIIYWSNGSVDNMSKLTSVRVPGIQTSFSVNNSSRAPIGTEAMWSVIIDDIANVSDSQTITVNAGTHTMLTDTGLEAQANAKGWTIATN